jgi:hypothetical protein
MAGYSGTPLVKKLGIGEDARVGLIGAPDGFLAELAPLPTKVTIFQRPTARLNVILFFALNRATLERRFAPLSRKLVVTGGLWVAWPKKASGVPTNVSDGVVREIGLAHGLVDNKVCAVNAVWSGLRFVVPIAARSSWAPD